MKQQACCFYELKTEVRGGFEGNAVSLSTVIQVVKVEDSWIF